MSSRWFWVHASNETGIPRSCINGSSLFIVAIAILASFRGAIAQTCEQHTLNSVNSRQWQGPLARTINLKAEKLSLTGALERVSKSANVRLTYSADALPAGRTICLDFKTVTLGDALLELLRGLPVQPVSAGNDQIALAPGAPTISAGNPITLIFPLKPVFAQATPVDVQKERPSYSVSVISGKEVTEQNSIAQLLNSAVPGVWSWQSPNSFTSQYSVRGASSFGVAAPKVYIDGIEVANPSLVTQIAPENVERVEFIRGPQGAALYGADAINGVTNIVTRHTPADFNGARLLVRSGLAVSQTDFLTGPSVGQDHNLTLQLGSRSNTATLNAGVGRTGEYVPGGYTRHFNLNGNARMLGERSMLTATGRYVFTGATPLSMQQYTFGMRGLVKRGEHFTHSMVLGADGYNLSGVPNDSTTPWSVNDSILRAAGDDGLRTTARLSTVGRFELPHEAAVGVTLSAEYSGLHRSRSAKSVSALFAGSWRDALFVNAGVRFEDDVVNEVAGGLSTMPMVGAAYVTGNDAVSVKFRAAYGKGVRWPDMPAPAGRQWNPHSRGGPPPLSPERQSGIEAGVDVAIAGVVGLQVTRYDQTASGLVQRKPMSALQNVGEIENSGWEMQATMHSGALALTGTLALTKSVVAGDRMLGVPARTASIDAGWYANAWSASVTAARAFDWIYYDRVAKVDQKYNGFTHLRASLSRDLNRGVTLFFTGDNLLGHQRGEPDNLTIVPGRTISLGVRANF